MKKKECERVLARREIRECKTLLQKAAKLVVDFGFSQRIVADVLGLSKTAVYRATKSFQEGREQGKSGRPCVLTPNEEAQLEELALARIKEGKLVDLKWIASEVSRFCNGVTS